ncbi:MAG: type II toxin-antitoxin system RelE/ParE family toxin [Bacteroidales bacterium]|nr:type II toxin-antitoxin system RelE/ParE family toxin [Bacteroidales bacterium]
MKKIYWSEEAERDFEENIDYLLKAWSVEEAETFVASVEDIIYNLKNSLISYESAKFKGINKSVVCKQITLFYREKSQNEIELIRFWNNYKDDKNLRL